MSTDTRKAAIISALRAFIAQRPGMDPRDYADRSGFYAESRQVTRDRHDAERLLREVELHDSITADAILKEADGGGRLTLKDIRATYADQSVYHKFSVSYCTGQYFPTEYRKAVARLAASVLWTWTREQCMPPPITVKGAGGFDEQRYGVLALQSAGDWLRAHFRREFGKRIAERYFS